MESIDSLAQCYKIYKGGIMKFKMHAKKENNKRLAQHKNRQDV